MATKTFNHCMKISVSFQSFHFIALIIGTVALSMAPIFVRYADTSAASIAFWRMLISTPLLALGWLLFPVKSVQDQTTLTASEASISTLSTLSSITPNVIRATPKHYFYLVLAGVAFALDLLCWNASLSLTSVANATLLVNFAALFAGLLSWLFLKQAPSQSLLIGMFIAILGGIFLVWPNFQYNADSFLGDGLGLLAGLFYGIYLLSVQLARPFFSTLSIMTLTGIMTAVTALIMALMLGQTLAVASYTGWAAIVGLAIVVQMIGQTFIAFALAKVSATLSAVVLLLQPVISALLAVWLFEETLVWIQTCGMGLIILGIGFAKLYGPKNKAADKDSRQALNVS